jgi:hypothetical protein
MPKRKRIRLEPQQDEPPLVLGKGQVPLTDAHRRLITILAEECVRQFLEEGGAERPMESNRQRRAHTGG